ncbi:hypothetical protein PHYC_02407 [Phycisphaerales bacterium]|nr:hypothetical protein PHYC_02407 [Phycisphaerales bacterium]
MTSVFIGGSRRLGGVNTDVGHRLDNIIQKGLHVLIGDAGGFDRAAQAYLAERGYRAVTVYCTAGVCRNNVGDWPLRAVAYEGRDRGLAFYTAKDDAMLRDADFGLFAWDGKSKGTLRNIEEMSVRGKACAVFIAPLQRFETVRTAADVAALSRDTMSGRPGSIELFSDTWRATG